MVRIVCAGAGDQVSLLKLLDLSDRFVHYPCGTVAEGLRLTQACYHFLIGGNHAIPFYAPQYFSDQIGTTAGFPDQAALRRTNRRALGARTNKRIHVPDQNTGSWGVGRRNFFNCKLSGSKVLNELFHTSLVSGPCFVSQRSAKHSTWG